MPPYLLISLEVRSYYQIEPTLNGVHSRDNLPKNIKTKLFRIQSNN